jgi:hypothetical protein
MKNELIEKYENLGLLTGIEDSKKEDLVQTYEGIAKLLLQERLTTQESELNQRIEVLAFPIIYLMYKSYNETDYKKVYSAFRAYALENLEKYKNLHIENLNFDYEAELCHQFIKSKKSYYEETNN